MTSQILELTTILIVEDSASDRQMVMSHLQSNTDNVYRFIEAETLADGLKLWRSPRPDLILLDLVLPDGNGVDFLKAIAGDCLEEARTPVIILTEPGEELLAVRAMELGATDYFNKGDASAIALSMAVKRVQREIALSFQLRRSQQQQTQILDQIHDAVIATTLDGIIQTWNLGAEKLYGYRADEAIGQNVSMLYFPEDLSLMVTAVFQPLLANGSHEVELRNRTKWGNTVYVGLRLSVVQDEQGNPVRLIGCSNDISDRHRAEEELRQLNLELEDRIEQRTAELQLSEKRLQETQAIARIGRWELDVMTGKLNWSPEIFEFFQLNPDEIELSHAAIAPYFLERDKQKCNELFDRAIKCSEAFETDFQIIRADGTTGYIFSKGKSITNGTGQVVRVVGITMDISDRKQAEQENLLLKERLQFLLASSPAMIYSCRPSGDYGATFMSKNIKTILGYEPEDFLKQSSFWASHIHPEDAPAIFANLSALFEQGTYVHEYRFLHHDGHYVWLRDQLRLVRDEQDEPVEIIGYFADISDRKQAEENALILSNSLKLALQAGSLGTWEWTAKNEVFWDNREYEIFGFQNLNRPITYQDWASLLTFEDVQKIEAMLQAVIDGKDSLTVEYQFQRPDGEQRWVYCEALAQRNEQGILTKIIGITQDITDRKQAELALQESRQFIQTVLDTIPLPVFWKDRESVYLGCNSQFSKIFNLASTNAIVGKNDFEFSPTEAEAIAYRQDDHEVMASGEPKLSIEETLRLPNGEKIWIETHKAPLRDWENKVVGVVGMFQDITIRKQAEIQLQETNEQLRRATQLKDEFLANMSHELRTPLNAIMGLSNALSEQIFGSLNEKQLKTINTIEKSSIHLLSLINDILDLSKISSGIMELNIEPVFVKNLCDSSLIFIKQQAFQKNVQTYCNIPKNIRNINVEERRLKQVLINLLSNAIKFTPSGGRISLLVAAGCGETWQGEAIIPEQIRRLNSPTIIFQVVDTGIGIAAQDLPLLFQSFVQIDSALNRQYTGTGLGLALVKKIVELHGGQVMIESELGQGSRFTVALPYLLPQDNLLSSDDNEAQLMSPEIEPINKAIAPLILLAEDNEANIQTFIAYLTAINYRIVVAKNGEEVVAMAQSSAPDVILMDIQMPIMDGLEAIRLIRANGKTAAIPIIALTALAMTGDREKCLEAGANEYLVKPIMFRQLNAAIRQILAT